MANVDVHAHIVPRAAAAAAKRGSAWHGLNLEFERNGNLTLRSRAGSSYSWNPRYWEDPEERRAAMRRQSVDVELLSISGSMLGYGLQPEDALGAAREINDEISALCKGSQSFLGLGTLPMQDAHLALQELERVGGNLGLHGIVVGANVNGELWDSPRLFPVLAAASEMGLFVFVHPDPWMYDRSLSGYHVTEVTAHQSQMTYAAASLIFGGILDRLPNLTICLAQTGGYVSYLAARLDHAYRLWPDAQVARYLPSTYLSRLYFDSLAYGATALRSLLSVVGKERVLLGTDYPSSVCVSEPVAWLDGCGLAGDEHDAILGKNFQRLRSELRKGS